MDKTNLTKEEAGELLKCWDNESLRRYGRINRAAPLRRKLEQMAEKGKCPADGDGICSALAGYSKQECNSRDKRGFPILRRCRMTARDEMREKIAMELYKWERDATLGSIEGADQILSVETSTHRLALVRKEGDLPEDPFAKDGGVAGTITYTEGTSYLEGQKDMLAAHYVQEESDT